MLKEQDLFEVIKGNINTIDLNEILNQRRQRLVTWKKTWMNKKDFERAKAYADRNNETLDCAIEHCSAEYPMGKKRDYKEMEDRLNKSIWEIVRIIDFVREQAFSEDFVNEEDHLYEYQVEKIVVKRIRK